MKNKLYSNIDAVPVGKWNLIVLALKYNRMPLANRLLHETLIKIKDIPVFEVFMLKRKLATLAGIKVNL
jgi:hypothetical protein